jgi:PPOX class probable F420-dependent enzyme
MDLDEALKWAGKRSDGVLITLRRDGRAQSSDIAYWLHDGQFWISLTTDRAKTANMRRDPRVVLHITDRPTWSYLSFDAAAEVGAVAAAPDDAATEDLVAYYRAVAGEHDDWDDYRAAMVRDGRLIVRLIPHSVVGQINDVR